MRSKILEEMSKEEFNEKIGRSLSQVLSGQSLEADDFLEKLTIEIAEAEENEQQEIWSELEKLSDEDLTTSQTHGFKAIIAMRVMQKQAEKNGLSGMTLEEINAEIDAARREKDC